MEKGTCEGIMTEERTFRYRTASLRGDYIRSAVGVALSALPAYAAVGSTPAFTAFMGIGALFVLFGARTFLRHRQTLSVSPEGVAIDGLLGRRLLRWEDISRMKLSYFQLNKRNGTGFMQLVLGKGRKRIAVESGLEDFHLFAAEAALHAQRHIIPIDPASGDNFKALGIDLTRIDIDAAN